MVVHRRNIKVKIVCVGNTHLYMIVVMMVVVMIVMMIVRVAVRDKHSWNYTFNVLRAVINTSSYELRTSIL